VASPFGQPIRTSPNLTVEWCRRERTGPPRVSFNRHPDARIRCRKASAAAQSSRARPWEFLHGSLLFQAHVFALLVEERMVSDELVDRMKSWRHSGFHAFAGDDIPDVDNGVRVGLYMVLGPVATSRLFADPAREPRLRYLAKGAGNDHSDVPTPAEYQDFDYLLFPVEDASHHLQRGGVVGAPFEGKDLHLHRPVSISAPPLLVLRSLAHRSHGV